MPVATAAVKPTRMSLRRLNINHLHRTLGKYAFALIGGTLIDNKYSTSLNVHHHIFYGMNSG